MTDVTCRLTAKNRDQLRNPTLGNRVRATFTFFTSEGRRRKTRGGKRERRGRVEDEEAHATLIGLE